MFVQLVIILVLLIPILAIVLDSRVGQALASRLERRGLGSGEELEGERLAYLEGEVERLSGELQRLDDESQFLHNLLTERASETEALPPGDSDE